MKNIITSAINIFSSLLPSDSGGKGALLSQYRQLRRDYERLSRNYERLSRNYEQLSRNYEHLSALIAMQLAPPSGKGRANRSEKS